MGYAGLLDLGYVAFYAVGAYTSSLITTSVIIDAVGPERRDGFDEVWTVNAYDHVKFQVEPVQSGRRMMGAVGYAVDIDRALYQSLSDEQKKTADTLLAKGMGGPGMGKHGMMGKHASRYH